MYLCFMYVCAQHTWPSIINDATMLVKKLLFSTFLLCEPLIPIHLRDVGEIWELVHLMHMHVAARS